MTGGLILKGRLYPSFRIDLLQHGGHLLQEGQETEKTSFTGFIWPVSELTLGNNTFLFVVARSKTQNVQELQHLCNLHFVSSQEYFKHNEHFHFVA